jgi:hypothetical protein
MKHVLKVILLITFLSNLYNNTKAQNVIMLKDRMYDTFDPLNFHYGAAYAGEIYQARIIDGFIYTIEAWNYDNISGFESWYYAKYDLSGNLIKRKKFPLTVVAYGVVSTGNLHQGFRSSLIYKSKDNNIICYVPFHEPSSANHSIFKFTPNLDSIKLITKNTANNLYIFNRTLSQTPNGNFLLMETDSFRNNHSHIRIHKLDENLNTIWVYDDNDSIYRGADIASSNPNINSSSLDIINGHYYITRIFDFDDSCRFKLYISTLDNNGILINLKAISLSNIFCNDENLTHAGVIKLLPIQNGYKIIFFNQKDFLSFNNRINIITYDSIINQIQVVRNIEPPTSNSFYISNPYLSKGFIEINNNPQFYNYNSTYSSATLNQNSVKPIPDSFYMYYPNRFQKVIDYQTTWIDENIDTSYLLLGKITLKDSGNFLSIIPLINSFGVYNGNVYKDNNKNCAADASDSPYKNRTIEVTKTNAPVPYKYYDFTDGNGRFEIFADTGNFSAKVFPNSDLWSACPSVHNFSLNNANDTVSQNFYLQRLINCPKLSVSIATDRLRPCFTNTYVVNYCNRGTADAVGATVQVLFDSAIAVNSASVSYSNIGNLYTFNVGTIKEDSCGQFTIATRLACTTTVGLTHCVTAHIFPDSLCVSADARWNRANVTVDGQCLGDSVRFRIRNAGTGNMTQSKKYYVVEDHVLKVTPQNFILNAGQELQLKYLANGSTIRLVAEQVDFFPYPSNPTAVVENCGGLSPGFVNSFPNNDAADFIAISCTQSVGSFDPNDKNGVPEGVNDQHLIAKNTDIDYKIRFQNTGTDTAYDVYILDTLSSKLNVASLQMGAASHPYRYEVYGDGQAILKVVFSKH